LMLFRYGLPYVSTVTESVVANRPAVMAGMRAGDSLVALDGVPLQSWDSLLSRISSSANHQVVFDVRRNGQSLRIPVTPAPDTATNLTTGKLESVGRIGILPKQLSRPVGVGEAMAKGWSLTWRMAGSVIEALRGLATRKVAASELGGPIMIATASVQAARSGLESLMVLVSLISVNLAVFNLLPIPILDGGQILVQVLEAIKGKAFSVRTREYILRAGLFAVLLLFALVTYNDLRRLVVSLIEKFG
jgi:regulator of sigma E protease